MLAGWPAPAAVSTEGPRFAAALTQTVGNGRLVLWQLPLGDWRSDPRSRRLLANAVDYLLTPAR